jgi:class 3 adenylate cyclase
MPEERKLVTILFADVTGSTALGESLDPEDMRALMGRYYEHARRVVGDYGGTLEKFIGDAVMAVFGLPQAHGNDAERALAAALALREAVAGDRVLAGRLLLRMGVNTGDVIATTDAGRGDFLITGDAVNVAARLEQTATPGEVLASERTAAAAQASFVFGEARAVEVKGKSQPLRVFPLTGQRPARQMGRPPLVGRKQDLAQLALLRDRALEERRPQLVSIVAPAGTGKTRLLEEFLARLEPQDGFRVATARCQPYGQTLTYWPLRGLLEELLGGEFGPEQVADAFAAAGHSQDDADRLAGLVLATLGIAPEGEAERETIFSAWRLLVEALAAQAPRIVVFEDLHWASDSLLDLVEHIMQPRTEAALLIVATSRPELLDRRAAWGGGRRSFTALALEPLSDAQTRTLVGKLAKKLPEATREQIVERSGGNPFFVIELTRALAERDLAGQASAPAALPDTVREAVQERLDLLSAREREVLQAASVAGRAFRPATLKAVLDAPVPAEIDSALDGLLARDLIAPAEGGGYTFRHILIRDVAYGTLSRAERIRMHTAVAAWLEQFAAGRLDEFVELIAYHCREAVLLACQSAVPLDVPVDAARAVHYLERAGELASRAGAFAETRRHLESAIEIAPEAEHPRLYEKLGDCLAIGDAGLAAYRMALEYWRAGAQQEPLVGARLLRKLLAILMRRQGSITERPGYDEVIALRKEARRLAETAGDEYELWRVRTVELFWPFWSGEWVPEETRALMAVGLEAAAYFEARGDWAAFSEALDAYATLARRIGRTKDSLTASRRRLAAPGLAATERGDALAMTVLTLTESGDYAGAIETARAAIAQRKIGEPATSFGHTATWAAFAACFAGNWAEISAFVAIVDEAWEEWQRDPGIRFLRRGYAAALHVALAQEDRVAADRASAAAERLLAADFFSDERALLASYRRDDPMPLESVMRSFTGSLGMRSDQVLMIMFLDDRGLPLPRALLDAAATHPRLRHIDAVYRCVQIAEALADGDDTRLAEAIEDAEAHGLIPHAARMRIVLARRTGDRAYLDRARPVLERLGDRQFLHRLEEVAASLG